MLDCSHKKDFCEDVSFWGFIHILSIQGVIFPKTSILRAWINIVKPNEQNIDTYVIETTASIEPNSAQW